jgi:hypothetical protein
MTAPTTTKKPHIKKKDIPEYLIYEMDEGKPIYYRGYKDVLNGTKTPEQIMGSSSLQSLMVSLIMEFVIRNCDDEFLALPGELGFIFGKKTWRSLDVALYRKKIIEAGELPFDEHYTQTPPEIVFEVDTKAEFSELPSVPGYYHRKTQQLLDAGVQKVIWVYTSPRKHMVAEQSKTWLTDDWDKNIELLPGILLNLQQLVQPFENRKT